MPRNDSDGPARRSRARQPIGRTLADAAHSRLRDGIVTLRLAPGAPLTEVDLCRRLGISRTPVRAALLRLQQEGLVETIGLTRSGRVTVAPLTATDMRELFLMVGALDGVAARLAADLPDAPRRAVAREMETINARLRALSATAVADIRTAQELDLGFHRCYEQAASGPRLLAKLTALHARRERYVRVYTEALIHTRSVQASLDEHGAIVAAIGQGDVDAAERHAVFNYRNALERYWRIVAVHGERGSWT
jgi:DNA-binding GntR family transcriptional regulator